MLLFNNILAGKFKHLFRKPTPVGNNLSLLESLAKFANYLDNKRDNSQLPVFISYKNITPRMQTDEMRARVAKRKEIRQRPDYVGEGRYGTVYSHGPGLVRKEIVGEGLREVQEELNNQLLLARTGLGARVDSYERDPHGGMQSIIMQDLRDNYKPVYDNRGGRNQIIDKWSLPGTVDKYRQFALEHQKQMGMLALQGMHLKDRHSGNLMQHKMTGRPIQLDPGIASHVTGKDQVKALMQATSQGFKASGQPDVADIILGVGHEYLEQGKVNEAWNFTKEAFANLQKIKKPLPIDKQIVSQSLLLSLNPSLKN